MVAPTGIIITVSVLLAAGLAAYENPRIREWIDHGRQKIAMAFYALGDDIYPRSRSPPRDDPSMREDAGDIAERRRRQARAEILERGRRMEERRKRRAASTSASQSFDNMVDTDGNLRSGDNASSNVTQAVSTAVEPAPLIEGLSSRHEPISMHDSVDSPIALRQLSPRAEGADPFADPFTSQYEEGMRNAWNLPLLPAADAALSSHASESLIDLTPTSESAPDPAISVPTLADLHGQASDTQYFSAATSTPHTLSDYEPEFYYAHPSHPDVPVPPARSRIVQNPAPISVSSAPSIAGSVDHVHASEIETSDDGIMSEFGDGMHTPASGWTEVGSVTSTDAGN